MKPDQTTVYIIIAAVIVGIYLGGSVVMTLVRILSRNMPQQQPYYPPHDNNYPDYNRQERGWGCWPTLFLLAVAGMLLTKAVNTPFVQELLNKDKGNTGVLKAPIETTKSRYSIIMSSDTTNIKTTENRVQPEANPKSAEPTMTPKTADPHIVRIAAFSNYESARAKMQKETSHGLRSGYYLTKDSKGNEIYAVFVGVYRCKGDAVDVKENIGERGTFVAPASGLDLHYFEEDRR